MLKYSSLCQSWSKLAGRGGGCRYIRVEPCLEGEIDVGRGNVGRQPCRQKTWHAQRRGSLTEYIRHVERTSLILPKRQGRVTRAKDGWEWGGGIGRTLEPNMNEDEGRGL